MPAPGPAAGTALAFFQLLLSPADAPLSGRRLRGILYPTDELVARQRRDVVPRSQSRGQPMHHPAGHLGTTHRATFFSALLGEDFQLTEAVDEPRRGALLDTPDAVHSQQWAKGDLNPHVPKDTGT